MNIRGQSYIIYNLNSNIKHKYYLSQKYTALSRASPLRYIYIWIWHKYWAKDQLDSTSSEAFCKSHFDFGGNVRVASVQGLTVCKWIEKEVTTFPIWKQRIGNAIVARPSVLNSLTTLPSVWPVQHGIAIKARCLLYPHLVLVSPPKQVN